MKIIEIICDNEWQLLILHTAAITVFGYCCVWLLFIFLILSILNQLFSRDIISHRRINRMKLRNLFLKAIYLTWWIIRYVSSEKTLFNNLTERNSGLSIVLKFHNRRITNLFVMNHFLREYVMSYFFLLPLN